MEGMSVSPNAAQKPHSIRAEIRPLDLTAWSWPQTLACNFKGGAGMEAAESWLKWKMEARNQKERVQKFPCEQEKKNRDPAKRAERAREGLFV